MCLDVLIDLNRVGRNLQIDNRWGVVSPEMAQRLGGELLSLSPVFVQPLPARDVPGPPRAVLELSVPNKKHPEKPGRRACVSFHIKGAYAASLCSIAAFQRHVLIL
jgi:hypothetical protein